MIEKEMWVYLLAYNLIRLLMAEAANQAEVLPRQLSFKHTLQIWVAWSARQFLSEAPEDTAGLFMLIAQIPVGDRPGRIEPRMIKRRPNQYTPDQWPGGHGTQVVHFGFALPPDCVSQDGGEAFSDSRSIMA